MGDSDHRLTVRVAVHNRVCLCGSRAAIPLRRTGFVASVEKRKLKSIADKILFQSVDQETEEKSDNGNERSGGQHNLCPLILHNHPSPHLPSELPLSPHILVEERSRLATLLCISGEAVVDMASGVAHACDGAAIGEAQ